MTETTVIDRPTPKIAKRKPSAKAPPDRSAKPATVTAAALAAHLDLSRQYTERLADIDGVLRREADGSFLLDVNRVLYLRFLRRERQQSPRSEAKAEYQRKKTHLLALKIAKAEGDLMMTDETMDMIDRVCGPFRTGLGSLPAMLGGHDLQMRRRVEAACNAILLNIHDEATAWAEKFERELGITKNDYPTPP